MRGISSVIAMVLILLISISLTGMAYMTSTSFFTTTKTTSEQVMNQSLVSEMAQMKVEGVTNGTIQTPESSIYIRNIGGSDLSGFSVYINDLPVGVDPTTPAGGKISRSELKYINVTAYLPSGGTIRVTTSQNAMATYTLAGVYVSSGGSSCTPNCAGRVCGSDGCGGNCPPGCSGSQTCDVNGQCQSSGGSWWDASYTRCRNITIDNSGNAKFLGNYQVFVNVTNMANMKADGSDIRFINDSCGNSSYAVTFPYWFKDNASVSGSFIGAWIKVDTIPLSSARTISMYYGNPAAISNSNIQAVMDAGDDFNDGAINATVWSCLGASEAGGYVSLNSGQYCYGAVKVNSSLELLDFRWKDAGTVGWTNAAAGSQNWYSSQHFAIQSIGIFFTNTKGTVSNTQTMRDGQTSGNWYLFTLNYSYLTSARYFRDGVSVWSEATNLPVPNMEMFYDGSNGFGSVDYVYARKFTSPEPIISIGAEQVHS